MLGPYREEKGHRSGGRGVLLIVAFEAQQNRDHHRDAQPERTPYHWFTTTGLVDEESWEEVGYYKHALYHRVLVVGLGRNRYLSRILTYPYSQNQEQISRETDIGLQYCSHEVHDLDMH
jgi:hypothetical protein